MVKGDSSKVQEEAQLSELDDTVIKLFILIVGCSGILYGIYFGDIYVSLVGFLASILLFVYAKDNADDFYKPIPKINQPLLETMIVLVLFFDSFLLIQPLLGINDSVSSLSMTLIMGFFFPLLFLTVYRGYDKFDLGIRKPNNQSQIASLYLLFLIVYPLIQIMISPGRILILVQTSIVLSLVYGIAVLGIVTGTVEEFLFRGIAQNRITTASGSRVLGLIVTSSLFALLHLFSVQVTSTVLLLDVGYSFLYAFLTRLPLGVILGIVWNETESLFPVIAIHATNNIGYLVLLLSATY